MLNPTKEEIKTAVSKYYQGYAPSDFVVEYGLHQIIGPIGGSYVRDGSTYIGYLTSESDNAYLRLTNFNAKLQPVSSYAIERVANYKRDGHPIFFNSWLHTTTGGYFVHGYKISLKF